ncbi:hypothetical protein JGS22_025480 [Streptomyces sp. P38-E01]|uniref:Uncharacterized protein n=1 Tax=Streptomyces tardus TaxID=2780544 RepID=A0A949JVJ7_9ACTN|nr:hypothetical protein [Streptomyces tardus]MBU7600880.1 hypothetical protein [Streptomyces tardus]
MNVPASPDRLSRLLRSRDLAKPVERDAGELPASTAELRSWIAGQP